MQCLEEKIREVKRNFNRKIPEYLEKIHAATIKENRPLVKTLCHDFSGTACSFGHENLAKIARTIDEQSMTLPSTELIALANQMKYLHRQGKG